MQGVCVSVCECVCSVLEWSMQSVRVVVCVLSVQWAMQVSVVIRG